jgi:hypothetical protein
MDIDLNKAEIFKPGKLSNIDEIEITNIPKGVEKISLFVFIAPAKNNIVVFARDAKDAPGINADPTEILINVPRLTRLMIMNGLYPGEVTIRKFEKESSKASFKVGGLIPGIKSSEKGR